MGPTPSTQGEVGKHTVQSGTQRSPDHEKHTGPPGQCLLLSRSRSAVFLHIALPLLGTGVSGLPRDVCLDTMFQFLAGRLLRGLTTIEDARIVLA